MIHYHRHLWIAFLVFHFVLWSGLAVADPWVRHAVDNTSIGADGVRIADVNGDGRMDIVTGWEEGGLIRVYVHPGFHRVKDLWPSVTVGRVASPEDAVFVDLNRDGMMDVLSSCEGTNRTLYIHWAPSRMEDYLDESAWKTDVIPASKDKTAWMYALPLLVGNDSLPKILVGSKGANAMIGLLHSTTELDPTKWSVQSLYRAGWIMSLIGVDMDQDGDIDVLASDRKTDSSGILWLRNPGSSPSGQVVEWETHRIGLNGKEVMFIDAVDLDLNGRLEIVACYKPNHVTVFRYAAGPGSWDEVQTVVLPQGSGSVKAVKAGDLDRDGIVDLAITCEGATGELSGVWYWRRFKTDLSASGEWRNISGPEGVKFDRIELLDLDGDGDLDLLTCEERDGLGVIWYENPVWP